MKQNGGECWPITSKSASEVVDTPNYSSTDSIEDMDASTEPSMAADIQVGGHTSGTQIQVATD